MKEISVKKRNGKKEPLDYEKINKVLLWSTDGISGVQASDIAMNAHLEIEDGIESKKIHEVLIKAAVNLITEETPNYQMVASKLLNYLLRKEVFNTYESFPRLKDLIKDNVKVGVYHPELLASYTDNEMDKLETYIKHKRDEEMTYAAIQQLMDKYLVQNRKTKVYYETPQFMYMCMAMMTLGKYEGEDRLSKIKRRYDLISTHKISLPTPILASLRTKNDQLSSCCLIDIDDSLDSIAAATHSTLRYISNKAGIGLNFRIRAAGSEVNGGEKIHTGILPFIKVLESATKSCSQGGLRNGSSTAHYPFWHREIMDILVLKNNAGNDLNRARRMDHSIQLCRLFYRRFVHKQNITLFSPNDVPDLYEAFGYDNDKFEALYLKYEADKKIQKITIPAEDLMNLLLKERIGTGRIYIMNIDNANIFSSFSDKIWMSNLCQEITLPTTPLQDINDENGEIATCVLAAYNLGTIKSYDELYEIAYHTLDILDYVIDYQSYPVKAAKKQILRRSVGVGVTNFAYWMAKNNLKYDDNESLAKIDELMEHLRYNLMRASCDLAKERGACAYYDRTKYAQGILPIDNYSENIDKLVKRPLSCDWDTLRSDMKLHGLRNSTLMAAMPVESSSVVSNSTNGFEAPRAFITTKVSKSGAPLPVIVPELTKLKNKYQLAWSFDNTHINNIMAVAQKWIDQGISVNHYYDKRKYTDDNVPLSVLAKDILDFYKYGGKQLYYCNSLDHKTDDISKMITTEKDSDAQAQAEFDTADMDSGCEGGGCTL